MARLNYTKAKGMYQDGDTMNAAGQISFAKGFVMSDVAVSQKAASVKLEGPVISLSIKTNEFHGGGNGPSNEFLHDVLFQIPDLEGDIHAVNVQVTGIDVTAGDSTGATSDTEPVTQEATNAGSTDFAGSTIVAIGGTDNASTAITKIARGIVTASGGTLGYTAAAVSGDYTQVKFYNLKQGRLSDASAALAVGEGIYAGGDGDVAAQEIAGTYTASQGIQVGDFNGQEGATSYSNHAYATGDAVIEVVTQGQSAAQTKINSEVASAAQSIVFSAESASDVDILDSAGSSLGEPSNAYTTEFTFSDPADDSPGQQITLINACSNRTVKATNATGVDSGNTISLEAGDVAKLIWNGAKWVSHPYNAGSPSVA